MPISETSNDCGADAAAYALGALEGAEADRFRRHLNSCTVCRAEVDSLQEVVDILPLSAPQFRTPPALRRRVLAEVHGDARSRRAAASWRLPRFNLLTAQRTGLALVAGLFLLGCVAIAGVKLTAGPSTQTYAASLGDAKVQVSGDHAQLIVNHLPQPGANRTYEVWLRRGNSRAIPTSALFDVTSAGKGDVAVPGNIHGVTAVMVTAEPAGGTEHPTTPPLVVASLT